MERFAIIDTETTGFGTKDRLVEIAVESGTWANGIE
jgi:DNA polymerase III epsilon subunit-like protein